MANDPYASILGELATPPGPKKAPVVLMSPEEREARARASLAVLIGQRLGLSRALSDEELNVALEMEKRNRAARAAAARQAMQVVGGGGNSKRLIVDDEGVGLGQIDNVKAESEYIDEVDKYLLDKDEAARVAGGDDLRTFMHMQARDQAEANKEAPFTTSNPQSAIGAVLGLTATINNIDNRDAASGGPMLVNWQGKDLETRPCTIDLSAVGQQATGLDLVSPGLLISPYAYVQFGTAGYLSAFEVDIGTGCQFTVGASSIKVSVGMDPGSSGTLGARISDPASTLPATFANVTGMLSFQHAGHQPPITRTKYVYITQGGTTTIKVPAFAKKVWFYPQTASNTYTVSFKMWGGNTIFSYLMLANTPMTIPIYLLAGVSTVSIQDTLNNAATNVTCLFELTL